MTLQGLILWAIALQLLRDFEYHLTRWQRFGLICEAHTSSRKEQRERKEKAMREGSGVGVKEDGEGLSSSGKEQQRDESEKAYSRGPGRAYAPADTHDFRLFCIPNLCAWLRLRTYLRDVKGKFTLELLKTCWLTFLPLMTWGVLDFVIDVTLNGRSSAGMRLLNWRIDRTFDTFMGWLLMYLVFMAGEGISQEMNSHKKVVASEQLEIAFDLADQSTIENGGIHVFVSKSATVELVTPKNMKTASSCMSAASRFLSAIQEQEKVKLLGIELNATSMNRLKTFLYTYVGLLVVELLRQKAVVVT